MTNVISSPEAEAPARRRRPRRRWPWVAAAVFLLIVAIAGFAAWLGTGLLKAAKEVKADATAARADLTAYRSALQAGDTDKAAVDLAQARGHMKQAHAAADVSQVHAARHVPVAKGAVADLDHLLRSADIVTAAGTDALSMYKEFSNHESGVFHDSGFDLPALDRANTAAVRLTGEMDRARGELKAVHGGPFEPGVLGMRDSALKQVNDLASTAHDVVRLLKVLPRAVGAEKPKSYVIAIMNPAELRFSGGAPLSLALATFDKGKMTISNRGQTLDLTNGNERIVWQPVKGDPWLHGSPTPLATSTISPDWTVAGEELLRAYQSQFHVRADGAFGLDPVALAEVLRVTGPIDAPGYGQITADTLVPTLIRDAYTTDTDPNARHSLNNQLMDLMVQRLMSGGQLMGKGRALATSAKGGHFQIYFRDATVQQQALEGHLAGALPALGTDDAGTFTQNRNASKVDYFQHRMVEQDAVLHPDGSADITRTITIENRAPGSTGAGVSGYRTGVSVPRIMTFVPARATVTGATLAGRRVALHQPVESGRKALWVDTGVPPGGTVVLVVRYHLPAAAVRSGDKLVYDFTMAGQGMVNPEQLVLKVTAPRGWAVDAAGRPTVSSVTRVVDKDLHFAVRFVQK